MARMADITVFSLLYFVTFSLYFSLLYGYETQNHPCCRESVENLTLSMILDPYEIYGHDPADKLDHLMHYQAEMMKIKQAPDQHVINEYVHIATDHLGRFVHLHIKELKVLLIALDDVIDNMLTMYDNHDVVKHERVATFNSAAGGAIPSEFYISQEFYCGKNVYLFVSELYSDIHNMGRGPTPYCKGLNFYFLGFVHHLEDTKYYLEVDPNLSFEMDNYLHGLECHLNICIFRFPLLKNLQHERDISTLPKAIVKCGLLVYKLPPLTTVSCVVSSGSFILDFNIQGVRFRHYDYLLSIPNGHVYYTKEPNSPLVCEHHVCEWNYTNFYGGPFAIPGESAHKVPPILPFMEAVEPPKSERLILNATRPIDTSSCSFMFPPNYGSIAGISYIDPLALHDYRYTCYGSNKGLYWYPQWMGPAPPPPRPHKSWYTRKDPCKFQGGKLSH